MPFENTYCLEYDGVKYFRMEFLGNPRVFVPLEIKPKNIFVTSLVFEQEPSLGENQPFEEVSQYPLEDILDKFNCPVEDDYSRLNAEDAVHSFVEFSSYKKKDIEKLLTIVGKHVYNRDDGDSSKLVIEEE